MTDHSQSNDTESDDAEDDEAYEVDHVVSRETGVATLRRLADGIATGSVGLSGDDTVTVSVPDQFELEIEYEESDDEAELEVELEWPLVDGEPEAVDDSDDADAEAVDAEAEAVDEVVGVDAPASKARFELFEDRADEWRWRLVHNNGNIIADSGEGYSRKATARKGLESVMRNASGARVVDDT